MDIILKTQEKKKTTTMVIGTKIQTQKREKEKKWNEFNW